MTHLLLHSSLLCLVLFIIGCSPREDRAEILEVVPEGAIGRVGSDWILESDIEYYLSAGLARDDAHALRLMVEEIQLAELAKADGFDDSAKIRAATRRLLASRYLETSQEVLEVSEAELRELWNASVDRFQIPARIKVAALRQQYDGDAARVAAIERLEEARILFEQSDSMERVRGFGVLGPQYSDEPNTRYQGGELGWIHAGQQHLLLSDTMITRLFQTPIVGVMEEVLIGGGAVWLVRIVDYEQGRMRAFEDVRAQLEQELLGQERTESKSALLKAAAQHAPLEMLVDLPQYQDEAAVAIEPSMPSL